MLVVKVLAGTPTRMLLGLLLVVELHVGHLLRQVVFVAGDALQWPPEAASSVVHFEKERKATCNVRAKNSFAPLALS